MESGKASKHFIACPKCGKTMNSPPTKTYSFDFYRELCIYTCSRCGTHFAIAEKFGLEKTEAKLG